MTLQDRLRAARETLMDAPNTGPSPESEPGNADLPLVLLTQVAYVEIKSVLSEAIAHISLEGAP